MVQREYCILPSGFTGLPYFYFSSHVNFDLYFCNVGTYFTNIGIEDLASSLMVDELIQMDSLEQCEQTLHRMEATIFPISTLFEPISKETEAKVV